MYLFHLNLLLVEIVVQVIYKDVLLIHCCDIAKDRLIHRMAVSVETKLNLRTNILERSNTLY